MRDSTPAVPSSQDLRQMMAMAAATASAAAGDANTVAAASSADLVARHMRNHPPRPSHSRRQSIHRLNRVLINEPLPKGAPLPDASDGSRSGRIAEVASEIANKWVHPPGSMQYETETLHNVRAILYISKSIITQSFVSHVSGVSQGSLSHYVRGIFRGNQKNVEDRLERFVLKFASGELDSFLGEARAGTRLPARALVMESAGASSIALPTSSAAGLHGAMSSADRLVLQSRPPVPPPPPPQLTPAPWARPSMPPPLPPVTVQDSGVTNALVSPHPPLPESAAFMSPTGNPGVEVPHMEGSTLPTERARRARQRQAAPQGRKRGKTPFTTLLEQMEEPTSIVAVERAFHALVAPHWTQEYTHTEPLLLPIELFVQWEGYALHMFTQWDVNERSLSPEVVADRIRRARRLPKEFAHPAAMQIRRALFDAGIICPPPPIVNVGENRRLIRIDVDLGIVGEGKVDHISDEFEWDLGMGSTNSPELFAQHLCTDANIAQRNAPTVARAIREKLCIAHALAYGDEQTKCAALECLGPDDPLRHPVPVILSALEKPSQQTLASRGVKEEAVAANFVLPLLDAVLEEAEIRSKRRQQDEIDEVERRKFEARKAAELAEKVEREAKLEVEYARVFAAATELQKKRVLDFRPYLAIKLGCGERPSVWTTAVFDRKRRRQTSFPMTQPTRTHGKILNVAESLTARSFHRRKSHRRSEPTPRMLGKLGNEPKPTSALDQKSGKDDLESPTAVVEERGAEVKSPPTNQRQFSIPLQIRIRAPKRKELAKSVSYSKKRRRR